MSKVVLRIEIPVEVMVNETARNIANHINDEIQPMIEDAECNLEQSLDCIEISCDIED
jgi:hypothetical protein